MSILAALEAEAKTKPRALPADTQQACIDLPGETVRCIVYKPKLEIMLRKHRDVIFELQLFKGMQYTVEAEDSDFYNARDKKLVEFKKKHQVTFTDGERMHLWVGREFKGALVLKAAGKVLGRYQPNDLDPKRYDADPATKPAPLLVIMKNEPAVNGAAPVAAAPNRPFGSIGLTGAPDLSSLHLPAKSPAPSQDQSMHVVEIKPNKDLPEQVASFFKQGGEQTAMDTNGILTRNWLWGQIVGAASYASDNHTWIKELWKEKFYLQRVKHKAGEKVYVVFKGNARLREFLSAARYGANHAKVIAITGGAGSAAGLRHAAWEGMKGSVKKAGLLALVFTIAIDTAEWLADYEQRDPKTGKPKKDLFDLIFKIGIDVIKAVVSAAMGSLIIGLLVSFGVVSGVAVVVVGTIAAAVLIGFAIDLIDKKTGTTERINNSVREAVKYLSAKIPRDYSSYENAVESTFAFGA